MGTLVRLTHEPSSYALGVEAWLLGSGHNTWLKSGQIGIIVRSAGEQFTDPSWGPTTLAPSEYVVSVDGKLYALYRYQLKRVKCRAT